MTVKADCVTGLMVSVVVLRDLGEYCDIQLHVGLFQYVINHRPAHAVKTQSLETKQEKENQAEQITAVCE